MDKAETKMNIYFATENLNKLDEVFHHLDSFNLAQGTSGVSHSIGVGNTTNTLPLKIQIHTIQDLSKEEQKQYNPIENGNTFQENSLIKAIALHKILKDSTGVTPTYGGGNTSKSSKIANEPFYVLAEDSGLEVDVLQSRPGLHSARYGKTSEIRNQKLLAELEGIPMNNRTARFIASLVFLDNFQNSVFFMGKSEGLITTKETGDNGFGYDPIFFHEASNKTFAQMTKEEKLKVSHRGNALTSFFEYLSKI